MILNYSVSFPGDCGCGASGHTSSCSQSDTGIYGANTQSTTTTNTSCGHQQSCQGCVDVYDGKCTRYTGANMVSTGINNNDDLNIIIEKLDAIKSIQDTKNANILAALNDINDRLNILESGDHAPYTLL